jgi:citrate synthase
MTTSSEVVINRGLRDVYFERTQSSFIDGREGKLLYRGYSIHDLAERSTFEETTYLLLYGKLPNRSELAQLDRELKRSRQIPEQVYGIIEAVKDAHPMDVLRTAVSALGAFDPDARDKSPEATVRMGIRLSSRVPTIVTAHHAIRNGRKPTAPSTTLSHSANFLYMFNGREPTAAAARLMDKDFVLHAEHGSNASSFTARVVTGTDADFHGSITAAIAALAGPSHGGAAEGVMRMALEIGEADRAADYVKNLLASGGRVMGFGHRVYRAEDPRARHLRDDVKKLSEEMGEPRWYQILEAVVAAMKPYARRGIHVNVDFYAGAIYYLLGIPEDLFVPIFAIGRVPGWTLQVAEQQRNNILIRPRMVYTGPMDLPYVPIDQR